MIEETTVQETGLEDAAAAAPEIDPSAEDTLQLIAFALGGQSYCVDIMSVREIRAWTGTTELPNTADFVRGVINLRGAIVPIIDLRTRFGEGATDPTRNHVVIIVTIEGRLNGILVDAVSDILHIAAGDVREIPETDGEARNPFLDGLITQKEHMVGLIALDRLIGEASVH